jgi:hypothetical protein
MGWNRDASKKFQVKYWDGNKSTKSVWAYSADISPIVP